MDPLVPGGVGAGGAAAVALSAHTTAREALLEKLRTGEWTYPETKAGEVNLSFIFDILLILAFLLLWVYAVSFPGRLTDKIDGINGTRKTLDNEGKNAIINYCLKGNFNGGQNYGLFKYVSFFTMEEVTNWLSVSFICTVIVLKILSGSANINAGYVIFAIIVGVIARHMRLGIKEQAKKQFPVVLFLVSLFIALWAYTDVFDVRVNDKSAEHGRNEVYVGAGVSFLLAAFVKTWFSVSDMSKLSDGELDTKAQALYDGEFAFYLTGASTAIVGASITAFVFCEALFIAYAATDYYAIPFYFLYTIPVYFISTVIVAGCCGGRMSKTTVPATTFNLILTFFGLVALVFAQAHVCSFPGPEGRHIAKNGCGALKTMGFKSLEPDAFELEMKMTPLIVLGFFAIVSHVMLYAGARFSRSGLTRTVADICANAETSKYSAP